MYKSLSGTGSILRYGITGATRLSLRTSGTLYYYGCYLLYALFRLRVGRCLARQSAETQTSAASNWVAEGSSHVLAFVYISDAARAVVPRYSSGVCGTDARGTIVERTRRDVAA